MVWSRWRRQDFMNYFKQCGNLPLSFPLLGSDTSTLPNYWNANKTSLINYIEESLNSLRGIVTDSITGQPLYLM